MNVARVGILLDRQTAERRWQYGLNVFGAYLGEILAQAGITFEWIEHAQQILDHACDIVLVALAPEDEVTTGTLLRYAEHGGTLISYAGLNGAAKQLGFIKRSSGAGYAYLEPEMGDTRPLRFLQAVTWHRQDQATAPAGQANGTIVRDQPNGTRLGPALRRFAIGRGALERWSVEIAGTIVALQQGPGPVLEDGDPAPDGTGAIDDGLLKADDRIALDWAWDRMQTESGAPYFAHPYADLWREAILSHLLQCVLDRGMTLPFVDLWPDGVSQVAMISHDSDENRDEHAESTLALLAELDIRTTWCMMEPGYGADIYRRIEQAGHELALHYNGLVKDGGTWGKAPFERQVQWLQQATGRAAITSNKNHYTRYEGWGELFEWCEACGIASDQTRGPSKAGNVGFIFGTCHPYVPIAWADGQNRLYDLLEIGFLTQDIPKWTDASVIAPFLAEVRRVRGVAHFLFHQVHIHHAEDVRASLRRVVQDARREGFVFWTGRQINDWARHRRAVDIIDLTADGRVMVDHPVGLRRDIVVWVPQPEAGVDGEMETRYGVPCLKKRVPAGGIVHRARDDA